MRTFRRKVLLAGVYTEEHEARRRGYGNEPEPMIKLGRIKSFQLFQD
jgi:hypothetical protein